MKRSVFLFCVLAMLPETAAAQKTAPTDPRLLDRTKVLAFDQQRIILAKNLHLGASGRISS